jgi:4-diphosphocytidyl-2-C-methyl-D-erythritol kinase
VKTIVDQVVRRQAPAKVNLSLAVLGRRSDGFHELESWVVPISLHDELSFAPAAGLSLTVLGMRETVRADPSNLVSRAATAMARAAGRRPEVMIRLEKRIPVGGGLGGGSSDAAATLLGLNALWDLNWPEERLMVIAAELGSDVGLFLRPGPVVLRGRGERVERLEASWEGWLAVVVPSYGLSTALVYGRFSPGPEERTGENPVWSRRVEDATALSRCLFNDLEPAAFGCEPRLEALHAALSGLEDRAVRMTGSGSCLFALFDTELEAKAWRGRASAHLAEGDEILVVQTA